MRLMGLVDPGPTECEDVTSGVEWESPLSEEEAEIFVTASRHLYFPNIRREDENDGLLYDGRLSLAVGIPADQVPQCDCIAHERRHDTRLRLLVATKLTEQVNQGADVCVFHPELSCTIIICIMHGQAHFFTYN